MAFPWALAISAGSSLLGGGKGKGPRISQSNIYDLNKTGRLSDIYAGRLLQSLTRGVTNTDEFQRNVATVRDVVGRGVQGAKQQLVDRGVLGGFLDSGAIEAGRLELDRAGAEATARGVAELIVAAEQLEAQQVLPFLASASEDFHRAQGLAVESAGISAGSRSSNLSFISSLLNASAGDGSSVLGTLT